jgi:hypothetical protein
MIVFVIVIRPIIIHPHCLSDSTGMGRVIDDDVLSLTSEVIDSNPLYVSALFLLLSR